MLGKDFKSFFTSVSVLFTGTVFSQILTYALSPIITRQYSPEDVAYLGLFLRVTTLGAAIATARLEFALPLEKQSHHAFGIYQFAFRFSIFVGTISLVLLFLFSGFWVSNYKDYLFLISLPIGVFFTAFFNLGSNWSLRKGDYKVISKASFLLSFFSNGIKLLLGFFGSNFLFLISATIFSFLLSSKTFFNDFIKEKKQAILSFKSKRTQFLLKKNSDLYYYNLPHVFIDLARDLLLASIIWNCYGKAEFGFFDHSFRMLKLPLVFIGGAIGQVFYKKCAVLVQDKIKLNQLVLKMIFTLGVVSVIPFGVIFFYGEELFSYVFGLKWSESGLLATVLAPWLMMNFISSPVSYLPMLLKKQRSFFYFNLIGTLLLFISVAIPYYMISNISYIEMMKVLSYSQAIYMIFVLLWFIRISNKNDLIT